MRCGSEMRMQDCDETRGSTLAACNLRCPSAVACALGLLQSCQLFASCTILCCSSSGGAAIVGPKMHHLPLNTDYSGQAPQNVPPCHTLPHAVPVNASCVASLP